MNDAEPLKRIHSQALILKRIALQTSECGRFVVNYASNQNFCTYRSCCYYVPFDAQHLIGKRTIKDLASRTDEIIQEYQSMFKSLREDLNQNVNANTQITVFRVLDKIDKLGA
jgi:hypothetical protein